MPVLTDTELRMVAEVVTEMCKQRGPSFDGTAKGVAIARALLIDPKFKASLAEAYRRLEARRQHNRLRKVLAPIGPSLRGLEREAEMVLSRWREPDPEAD